MLSYIFARLARRYVRRTMLREMYRDWFKEDKPSYSRHRRKKY